ALEQDPENAAYAQHSNGERATWDGGKLLREGDHPIIYPAAGSHASYYGSRTWRGWGPGGTGFGCDITTRPHRRVPLQVKLIPDHPDPNGEFAWLDFGGGWGEHRGWEYNGPRTPTRSGKWRHPVSWVGSTRDRSLFIPESLSLGPTPGGFFCEATAQSAKGLMFFTLHPWRVAALVVAL